MAATTEWPASMIPLMSMIIQHLGATTVWEASMIPVLSMITQHMGATKAWPASQIPFFSAQGSHNSLACIHGSNDYFYDWLCLA